METGVETFGAIIRRRRHELEVSRDDLARDLMISYWTLADWENDRVKPNGRYLAPLAEALDVPVADLAEALA